MSIVPVRRLLTAVVDLYRAEAALGGSAAVFFGSVLQAVSATPYPRAAALEPDPAARVELPVREWLAKLDNDGPLDAVLARLRTAEPLLDWLQDRNVIDGDMANERLGQGYGAVEIVGPKRTFKSPSTTIGFWLLAPGLSMPVQSHAAEQTCHVVSGEAEWNLDRGPWRTMTAGSVIHHPPLASYGVRTLTRPLLVLYCRRGDPSAVSGEAKPPRQAVRSGKRTKGPSRD